MLPFLHQQFVLYLIRYQALVLLAGGKFQCFSAKMEPKEKEISVPTYRSLLSWYPCDANIQSG